MKRIAVLTSGADAPGMIAATQLTDVVTKSKQLDLSLLELAKVLVQ